MNNLQFAWKKYYPWYLIADLAIVGLLIAWIAT